MSSRELDDYRSGQPAQLADVLERVLDKGIVIAGDIQINLLDIELLTVKIRLLIASSSRRQRACRRRSSRSLPIDRAHRHAPP
ncbi:MAG: gas vesicle protein [Actinobacteria bacterium]|nr:MAG: gas vesicle protein [Actinomycetota bacterium]